MHYFPEYFDTKEDLKSSATIRDLLTMSAGFKWEELIPFNDTANDNRKMFQGMRWSEYALSRPMAEKPFTSFNYNSGCPVTVAGIIEKASGMRLDEFAGKYLFAPLGITQYGWLKDATGLCHAGGGNYATPQVGPMFLNQGFFRQFPNRLVNCDRDQLRKQGIDSA